MCSDKNIFRNSAEMYLTTSHIRQQSTKFSGFFIPRVGFELRYAEMQTT